MRKGFFASTILFNITLFLLVFLLVGTGIALDNQGVINTVMKAKTSDLVQTEDISQIDSEYFKSDYDSIASLQDAAGRIVEEILEEGAVLLKNNDGLPIAKNSKVSVFGITAVDPVYSGIGSGDVAVNDAVPFVDYLDDHFQPNTDLWRWYNTNKDSYKRAVTGSWPITTQTIGDAHWNDLPAAKNNQADAAIYMIGRIGGEEADLKMSGFSSSADSTNGNYLALSPKEKSVLSGLRTLKAAGTIGKIVLLINSANQIEMDFLDDPTYGIDACLWIGNVGKTGLGGVANILSGDVNPSGRLTDAYWTKHYLNPVHANFGLNTFLSPSPGNSKYQQEYNRYVVYQEGIYLGYRYAETRYEDVVMQTANAGDFDYSAVISHPFGFGLSYTTFEYTAMSYTKSGNTYSVKVDVKNTGGVPGKEVVQVYVQKPYTPGGTEKSAIDLVGFAKTEVIQPGQTRSATVAVEEKYFATYDADTAKTYTLDPGDYYLAVGKNSHDALNNILSAKGFSPASTAGRMDAAGSSALTKKIAISSGADKYSVSTATGKPISNQFDFVDLNKYDGRGSNSVEYISRANWTGTTKLGYSESGANLSNHVVITKTAQMTADQTYATHIIESDVENYPTYGAVYDQPISLIELAVTDPDGNLYYDYDDPLWDLFLDQLTWQETVDLLSDGLRKTAPVPSVVKPITYDGNGPCGLAETYGANNNGDDRALAIQRNDPDKDKHAMAYPSNGTIAATFNIELAERVGVMLGEEALWAGYSGLYGTGVNLHRSPYQGRVFEYYSEDPILSGLIVAYWSRGVQSKGCYVYNKHLALNEQEAGRYGLNTFANEQSVRELYLRAFEIPIVVADAKCIMTSLNRIGVVWAGASYELNTVFLRDECGMSGFVVSDWYNGSFMRLDAMVLSGNDIPDGYQGGGFTVNKDELDRYQQGYSKMAWAMRESAKRIMFTVMQSNAMNGIVASTRLIPVEPYWIPLLYGIDISVGALTAISGLGAGLLYFLDYKRKLKNAK